MTAYAELLRDPRWQRKRLEILQRDGWRCQRCLDDQTTLAVHHRYYVGVRPWEYPPEALITLCEVCHAKECVSEQLGRDLIVALRRRGAFASELGELATVFGGQGQWDEIEWSVVIDGLRRLLSEEGLHQAEEAYFKRVGLVGKVDGR